MAPILPELHAYVRTARTMLPIPRRHVHYVFAVLQSGLTTFAATGIASAPSFGQAQFAMQWLSAWSVAWLLMIPLVLVAAPALRRIAAALTRPDEEPSASTLSRSD